jgi:hypothetical protein
MSDEGHEVPTGAVPPDSDPSNAGGEDPEQSQEGGVPEGGAKPEGTAMTPQEFIPILSKMPPNQQEAMVNAIPNLSDDEKQGLLHAAREFAATGNLPQAGPIDPEEAAEALEQERTEAKRKWEEAMALYDEGNTKEAAEMLAMPEKMFDGLKFTYDKIGESETLTEQVENDIVDKWKAQKLPNSGEAVNEFIIALHPELRDEERDRLVHRLTSEVEVDPDNEDLGTEPDREEIAGMDTQRTEAEKMLGKVDETIVDKLANEQLDPEERAKLKRYHNKVGGLKARFDDLFAEGTKGRKIAQRGGKMIYYAMLAAIVLLLLEMNIIYKASKQNRR